MISQFRHEPFENIRKKRQTIECKTSNHCIVNDGNVIVNDRHLFFVIVEMGSRSNHHLERC